jgi:hypothetical protein
LRSHRETGSIQAVLQHVNIVAIVLDIKNFHVVLGFPLGMRASGSHIVDFTGQDVEPEWLLGGDNDYLQEPWFSAGAIRFAAVHVGGCCRDALTADQANRSVGRMGIAESGYALLDRAAEFWAEAAAVGAAPVARLRVVSTANATSWRSLCSTRRNERSVLPA